MVPPGRNATLHIGMIRAKTSSAETTVVTPMKLGEFWRGAEWYLAGRNAQGYTLQKEKVCETQVLE